MSMCYFAWPDDHPGAGSTFSRTYTDMSSTHQGSSDGSFANMSVNSLRSPPGDHQPFTPSTEPPALADNWSKDRRRVAINGAEFSTPNRPAQFVPRVGTLKWAADGTSMESGSERGLYGLGMDLAGEGGEGHMMVLMSDVEYVDGSPP